VSGNVIENAGAGSGVQYSVTQWSKVLLKKPIVEITSTIAMEKSF
jgi:hypothetical protein